MPALRASAFPRFFRGADDRDVERKLLRMARRMALAVLWGTLNEAFDLRDGQASAAVDFDARETTVYALAALSLKLGQIARLGIYFGFRALRAFLRVRSRRKQEQKQRKAA